MTPAIEEARKMADEPVGGLKANIRQRGNEWVLEISGALDDTKVVARHTEPLTTALADVPGLPSLYRNDLAAISDAYLQGWSDCMEAVCVPDDSTRMTDEQGLALYLKEIGCG